eukprot:scaffold3803_cov151-Skeletonema_menzelii.AAC.5
MAERCRASKIYVKEMMRSDEVLAFLKWESINLTKPQCSGYGRNELLSDIAKALEYYKKAADLSRQLPCPVKYATLASHYATGKDDSTAATAASVLGLFFQDGNGLTSSLTLATH